MINKLTRRPLTKFLNKMSNYSFELLSKQENMQEYSKLFLDVLKLDEASVLRERFSRESDNLINKILGDKQVYLNLFFRTSTKKFQEKLIMVLDLSESYLKGILSGS